MMFWACLSLVAVVEIAYWAVGNFGYFAFATAEQAQAALLAWALFAAQDYNKTARKAVALLAALWFTWVFATDWSEAFSPCIGAVETAIFAGWCVYAWFRIHAVQDLG